MDPGMELDLRPIRVVCREVAVPLECLGVRHECRVRVASGRHLFADLPGKRCACAHLFLHLVECGVRQAHPGLPRVLSLVLHLKFRLVPVAVVQAVPADTLHCTALAETLHGPAANATTSLVPACVRAITGTSYPSGRRASAGSGRRSSGWMASVAECGLSRPSRRLIAAAVELRARAHEGGDVGDGDVQGPAVGGAFAQDRVVVVPRSAACRSARLSRGCCACARSASVRTAGVKPMCALYVRSTRSSRRLCSLCRRR